MKGSLPKLLLGFTGSVLALNLHTASADDLWITTSSGEVWKVDTVAGSSTLMFSGQGLAEDGVVDCKGVLYFGGNFTGVQRIDTNSNPPTLLSPVGTNIVGPEGGSIQASSGDVFFNTRLEPGVHTGIWRIPGGTAGTAINVVGPFSSWGEGSAFLTTGPFAGDIVASDSTGGRLVHSPIPGSAVTFASTGGVPLGVMVRPSDGDVFVTDAATGTIQHFTPSGSFVGTFVSGLSSPLFGEFDGAGNLFVAEANGVIKKVTAGGAVSTLAVIGSPVGVAITPNPFCTPAVVQILPATTRWKPQRGDEPITVDFTGPDNLNLDAGTLEIAGPAGLITFTGPITRPSPTGPYRMEWTGPWTYTDPADGQVKRLPAANYPVVVVGTTGTAPNQQTLRSAPYDKVSLVEVKTIQLVQCGSVPGVTCQDGGARLDGNTGPGGGRAAFPDATQPGGDYRRTVLVRADLEPSLGQDAGQVTVHFRSIDADDPSASAAGSPVDDDTVATNSTDNRNEDALIVPSVAASPDQGGAAIGFFRVSTQQGNNYRLAASTYEPWLGGISGVVSSQAGDVTHTSGETLTQGVQVAAMLTVWRTLRLELSRLDPSPRTQTDLQYNGTWTNLSRRRLEDASAPFFSVTIDGLLDHTTRNGWEGADVNPFSSAGQDFRIERNDDRRLSTRSGDMCSVVPAGFCRNTPPNPTDRSYYLRDDKLSRLVSTGHDVSILEDLLESAYIDLEALPSPDVPWDRNLEPQELEQLQGTLPNSAPYWSVLFLLGFDPELTEDYDPSDDGSNRPNPPVVGRCDPMIRQPVSVAHLEAIRDYIDTATAACIRPTVAFDEFQRGTTAHEVLHALSLGHDGDATGGIMCSAIKIFASQPNRNTMTERQRARLRELRQPGAFRPVADVPSCVQIQCP